MTASFPLVKGLDSTIHSCIFETEIIGKNFFIHFSNLEIQTKKKNKFLHLLLGK
jgi:hypothetical protein